MINSTVNSLVGTMSPVAASQAFKDDVAHVIQSYDLQGGSAIDNMPVIARNSRCRRDFVNMVMESVVNDPQLASGDASQDPFYSTYADRLDQLLENSLMEMARESVMTGYAPIQSYAPFMLKRQWVSCVWKDVLAADVAKSNIIKLQMEERWVKDAEGQRYRIPDVYYNKELMAKLFNDATGINLKHGEEDFIDLPLQNECLIDPKKNGNKQYFESDIANPNSETLTHDYTIFEVVFEIGGKEYRVPCDIKPDLSSHVLINGNNVKCVYEDENGEIKSETDSIVGNVDFQTGTVSVFSTNGLIKKFRHKGKAANRFNHRSLSVERTIKPLTFYMPESGPRLNAAVTIEEAQDAIVLNNTDLYADNTDMMGDVLANLQDIGIKSFVENSYEVHSKALTGPFGYEDKFTAEGSFNAVPIQNFSIGIDAWMNQAKEYFERVVEELKYKLKTPDIIICAVCHPSLVRYLKADVRWIFSDQTDVSGVKLAYKVGVTNANGDRVHIITSTYMSPEDPVRLIVIPTTTECITFKHIMHSAIIDRGYQNPLEPLVPNVMATQRTLTFEVTPVQGTFTITGRAGNTNYVNANGFMSGHAPNEYNGAFVVNNTTAGGTTGTTQQPGEDETTGG